MPSDTIVLVTRRIPVEALALLEARVRVVRWDSDQVMPRPVLLHEASQSSGILCLLTERIDVNLLNAAPNLKVVANMAVGYDNLDMKALAQRGVVATNTPGVLTETTADLAFALILAVARRLPEAWHYVQKGRWVTWGPMLLLGRDVHGATLGIVGMGQIGKAVARRAKGFGMRLLYHSRKPSPEAEVELEAVFRSLDDILSESDFVSIHLPLTDATRSLLSEGKLRMMKPTAYLINTARGPIVDHAALYRALTKGWIAGAALDVTDPEPISSNDPLLSLSNCLVVPHIGSASIATRTAMATLAARNILAVLDGKRPITPILSEE